MKDEHLKTLQELWRHAINFGSQREADALTFAISAIERSRWVAVEEREPEKEGVYYVTVDDDSVDEPTVFEAQWYNGEFVTNDHYLADIGTVTAWTKLEPYTPKEQI